jgi:tRNA modification GTPase
MEPSLDTIAAVATPPGRGGIGIVRVSGPAVPAIAVALLGAVPRPRQAALRAFRSDTVELIDEGLAIYFPAPHSFTGEHVLELHAHGGPVLLDMLMTRLLELGARQARPGEFSERAFLNDKLDLAQAEAIADLIDSSTREAARAAARTLQGVFSARIRALVAELIELRSFVEAAIDFPDEEIDFLEDAQLQARLNVISDGLQEVETEAQRGQLLREGMTVVIAGQPNAGKSSLLNALAGHEAAIVTPLAGTTRDLLREHIQIDGMPLHVIDTAGLTEASDDPIEREGVRRAWAQIAQADRILLVIDDERGFGRAEQAILDRLPQDVPHTLVFNKVDLSGRPAGVRSEGCDAEAALSARSGAGVDALRTHLKSVMGYAEAVAGGFSARRRHLDALQRAAAAVQTAEQCLSRRAGELVAEELREAQRQLGKITGEFSSDDLLGKIFAGFCIGK